MADFQDIREYRQAVEMAHASTASKSCSPRRAFRSRTRWASFARWPSTAPSGFLVRNLAGVAFCAEHGIPFVADFSLNAANELTVDYLRSRGAERVTVSYDLNRDQLLDLVAAVPPAWLEVVIHQHMPMFHMEHCVFCAVLSPGTNKTQLRPALRRARRCSCATASAWSTCCTADVGCRNTLFNAVPQSAAEAVPQLVGRGVRDFRIELLADSGEEVRDARSASTAICWPAASPASKSGSGCKASNRVGVTRGTLEERRNPLAIL